MTSFYFEKLILNDEIRKKKTIKQEIKENAEPYKFFKPITRVIRIKIPCMEKH